ncbi:hypothetical protein ABZ816_25075 [Actinosynnema sp. NPDC047251]|uniref:Uncharacterized protein n=1 Tax=Saccharothrix espanaensis (strain ATCC 51144 / DSM 44229 / JCM 9112 / NBRC 15066 / NRRL 15764) TaxID=1179773 RepID=K0K4A5_SACES|nr:hypothetical protein [Saccharothrix espanaensis]CCH31679.1 hypothetical protein BN6_43970 [Saccharothrix espanaensis DSM 44229]
MTIYSQHPSRGKIQVLATYRSPGGVVSATVTSLDDTTLATPIVDALNRISACATVPVGVHDNRDGRFEHYPSDHLAALTEPGVRRDLLTGAHSLWYEYVKALLHDSLLYLDECTDHVPDPVRLAINAELEAEARGLREAVAEFTEGIEPFAAPNRRVWDFEAPFVSFGDVDGLGGEARRRLDDAERDLHVDQVRNSAADLRLLLDAYTRCDNDEARLLVEEFSITDDPFDEGPDRLFLAVEAPLPGGAHGRADWGVEVCRWVADDPEDEDSGATGEPVLRCGRTTPPSAAELAELLDGSGGSTRRLAEWAGTPVGEALPGTAFVVTKRYEV